MERKILIYSVLLAVLLVTVIGLLWLMDKQAAPKREALAQLAQCLSEKEAIFYGAFWCPACAQQKAMFGGSAKKLPYIECSLPDRTQNEFCTEREIANYPVWEFDGSYRCGGVTNSELLAHFSGCAAPQYDDIAYTTEALYERLVVDRVTESLKKRGTPASTIGEVITEATAAVDTYLTDKYGTTVDTVENAEHLLIAIAETQFNCAPYEKSEVATGEEMEPFEIEVLPAEDGAAGSTGAVEIEAVPAEDAGGGEA